MFQQVLQKHETKTYLKDLVNLLSFNLRSHIKEQFHLLKICFYQLFLYVLNI
jgi:hypothetical protein